MKKAAHIFLSTVIFMPVIIHAQTGQYTEIKVNTDVTYQTVAGFGASLAYYENWLTAHPNRAEIYNAIFGELSLDILRVRNAYGYDAGMINRVKEFAQAAQKSLGKPIEIMVSSWSPPGSMKSNKTATNGGTIKYTVSGGKVNFQYEEFAHWWNESLNNYNANGIYPAYISIQNEPDYKDTWETCLLSPTETVKTTDTIAGYNKALNAVYDTVLKRNQKPRIIGPETVGIGYNAVENYINALDIRKIDGIAHHLYHGVDENDPYASTYFAKAGSFHPEKPHFMTEYNRGDWFSLAGLIYKTLNDENSVAYLYWDLIWSGGGLVNLEYPWDASHWQTPKGYTKTKEFYSFKQFSAFIHPGWKRVNVTSSGSLVKILAFTSAGKDSATLVAVNTSATASSDVKITLPGYKIIESKIYRTSSTENGVIYPAATDSITLKPKSITTVAMKIAPFNTGNGFISDFSHDQGICGNFPNPFREYTTIRFSTPEKGIFSLFIYDIRGILIYTEKIGIFPPGEHSYMFNGSNLNQGIYLYKLQFERHVMAEGKMVIID